MDCNVTEICSHHIMNPCDILPPPDPPIGHPLYHKIQEIKLNYDTWKEYSESCLGIKITTMLPQIETSTILPDISQSVTQGVTEIFRNTTPKIVDKGTDTVSSAELDWIIGVVVSIVCIIVIIVVIIAYKTCHNAKNSRGWRNSLVRFSWARKSYTAQIDALDTGQAMPTTDGQTNSTHQVRDIIKEQPNSEVQTVDKTSQKNGSHSVQTDGYTNIIPFIELTSDPEHDSISICVAETGNSELGDNNLKNYENLSLNHTMVQIRSEQEPECFKHDGSFNSVESDSCQNSDCGYFTNSTKTCDMNDGSVEELCNSSLDVIIVADKVTGDQHNTDVTAKISDSYQQSSQENPSNDPEVEHPTKNDISVSNGSLADPSSLDISLAPFDHETTFEGSERIQVKADSKDDTECVDVKTNQAESCLSHDGTGEFDGVSNSTVATAGDGVGNMTLSPSMELQGDLHNIINGAFT